MDNDDNDYQGHGLHLASEESSKISPVLRPYALPKFDFDEGHLRFDSLVENEVFLGIPSQEDNQWIEDFSRGGSGIEFSSSAADSCSIPRHNVWSEATSSESVEMLLKSVGQEEIVAGESIVKESDAGDVLPCLTESMDHNLRQEDRADEVKDHNSGFLGSLTSLGQNPQGGGVQSNYAPQSQEVDLSAYGYSSATGEKSSITTEENLNAELKFNEDNAKEDHTSLVESLNNKMQEDSSISVVETGGIERSSPNSMMDSGQMNVEDKRCNIPHESVGYLQEISKTGDHNECGNFFAEEDEKLSQISAEDSVTDLHSAVPVASELEVIAKSAVETTSANVLESPSLSMEGNANLLTEKGCIVEEHSSGLAQSSRSRLVTGGTENASLSESENFLSGKTSVSREAGDVSSIGQTVEVCNNDSCAFDSELNRELVEGTYTEKKNDYLECSGKACTTDTSIVLTGVSSGMKIEPTKHGEHENDNGGDNAFIPQGSVSGMKIDPAEHGEHGNDNGGDNAFIPQGSVSGMQIEPAEHGEHDNDNGGDNAFIPQGSVSVKSVGAEVLTESSKSVDDDAEIDNDVPKAADHVFPTELAVSSDNCGVVPAEQPLHDCNQDVTLHERDGRNFAFDPDNTPSETVGPYDDGKNIPSSSLDKVTEDNVEKTLGSQFDASVGNKTASNAKTEDAGTHETVDNAPSLPEGGVTAVEVSIYKEGCKPESSGVETLRSGDKDVMDIEAPIDASISRDAIMKQFSDSIVTKGASNNYAAVVSEGSSQPLDLVELSDKATHEEQAVAGVHQEQSDQMESASVSSDPDLSKSDAAEAEDLLKHKESTAAKDHGLPSLSVAGGGNSSVVEKSNSGSASIVTATELSQSATKQAGTLMVANAPHPDGAEGVNDASSTPMPVKDVTEEERSFTFDVSPVAGLTEGETTEGWKSFSSCEAGKTSTLVEGSPSISGGSQIDSSVQEASHGSVQKLDNRALSGGSKSASERKTRRSSGRSAKENARKHVKDIVPVKQMEKGNTSGAFYSPSVTGKLMRVELGNIERSGAKPSGVVSVSGSSLPDLNTSTPPSVLFHQPFTDMQQVQLRAQIFVYGSLIQGVAPDEACMASAFGISDGGRSIWESAWRTCAERLHGQKPNATSSETPVPSRSGAKVSDQANKQGPSQSKVRGSSKSTPSPVVNPMIPLSSPLWNVPTPSCDTLLTNNLARGTVLDYQALSPIHAYQTPAMRNFSGHTTSWVSQAPFPAPWVASPQSSPFDISAHCPALPATETVKVTTVKESSTPTSSIAKHTSPVPGVTGSSILPGTSLMHDTKKTAVSHTPHTADPKSKKRKKASGAEDLGKTALPVSQTISVSSTVRNTPFANRGPAAVDLGPASLLVRNQGDLASASAASGQFSTSVAIANPSSCAFKSSSDKYVREVSPISSNDHPKGVNRALEKRALLPEDIAKVAEAKLQAEEAAAHASVAVSHCQSVWYELDKQKNSGLMSDVEAKLASAAVAIAAAASVAKAAAAAAKIASNAAMQAKQMADEALISTVTLNPVQNDAISLAGFVNCMGSATPASILKVGDGNNGSSSIIVAAREASRRRMEAASAASRHAENLDAVVKAAELAAEAVSQAGKIVALSEPLPLRKLAEVGPEGYWKITEKPSGQDVKSNNVTGNTSNDNNVEEVTIAEEQVRPSDKEVHTTDRVTSPHPREASRNSMEDPVRGEERITASSRGEKDLRGVKNRRTSDSSKTISVVPESEMGLRSTEQEAVAGTLNDNTIKENCLVEVCKDNGDFGAWFSANVLDLKDGKALVCYTELESDEGKLKEWVPLETHGSKPPIIRLAHPTTSAMFEGTRKRRRAAARDHTWSLGDRVDAWMGNCWREGVIVEKNKKDESTMGVHFPVQGKISVVKVWHLRSTRMWKDGEWIELPSTGQDYSFQGDTPQEKRVKMGSPAIEGKGKGKMPSNADVSEPGKPEESSLLPLSAAEKVFNIGSTKYDKQPETLRTMRSGLQKEGSKVIFGVPKPGKKRKFMEVSKHYTSDRSTKNNVSTDSEKFANYLMPQGPGARAWKNNSKIDPKEKQAAESKTKAFKSGKPPSVSTRTLPRKENSQASSVSAPRNADLTNNVARNSTSNDKNDLGEQSLKEFVSSSNVKEGVEPISLSSKALTSNVSKKLAVPSVKSERVKRGKLAPAGGKSFKVEVKERSVPEVVEPRRSNRRIQPTSRLLEGLQSSLIISKIPSASHDKSHRNQNKGVSKGNN